MSSATADPQRVPPRPPNRHQGNCRCAGLVLLAALVVYTLTLAPTVTLVDSGELIVAARTLGVAHPPGFPLYLLLAHLATLVPLGNVAARVNFASALFAACATAAVSMASAQMALATGRQPTSAKGSSKRSPRRVSAAMDEPRTGTLVQWIAPLVSALLLAFSNTLWSYATVAEVYTLNTLLVALIFLHMFNWRRQILHDDVATSPHQRLYAAAFLFGLALGVHHVTVGLTLPAIAVLVYATEPRVFASKVIVVAALCACAGLMIYVYLPLAAAHAPALNWGDPRTLQRFWWHVSGRQFQAYFSLAPARLGTQLAAFASFALREFGPPWLPAGLALSLAGLYTVFRRDRTMFWFLLLLIAADMAYAASYEIAEDKTAYYLPTFVALCLAAGSGARWLVQAASTLGWRYAAEVVAATLLLVPIVALANNIRFNDRHRDFIAQEYVDNLLDILPPNGMLLTLDWQVYSPMLYVRTIEQRRPDAVVIDVNLLRRSWYLDHLEREYPELLAQTHAETTEFLEDLRHWEQDPELYQRDRQLNARIDARFVSMILAFVHAQLRVAPAYVTEDLVLGRDTQDSRLTQALTASYQLVPQGLAFQLHADRAFFEPSAAPPRMRHLLDPGRTFEPDDVVRLKVFPVYLSMVYNRGRYLAINGRRAEAIAAYRETLRLDPNFVAAQRALAESTAAR